MEYMIDQHQGLVNQHNEIKDLSEKWKTKTLILLALVVGIVCGVKSIQTTASINLNIISCSCVGILLVCHFWDFKFKRSLDEKKAELVIEGVKIEKQYPFAKLSFFQNYLKEFNILGEMARIAIFDFAFLYFFSVSATQLLKTINPEIVAKLIPSTPVRTFLISLILGLAYYIPLRPISHLKKKLQGSWV